MPVMEKNLSANLRVVNDFILVLSVVLVAWMSIGGFLLRPLCDLKQFESRKLSCLSGGVLEMRDRISIVILICTIFVFLIILKHQKFVELNELNASVRNQRDIGATVVVLASISTLTYYPSFNKWYTDPNNEFNGFGFDVTFLLLFLTLSVFLFGIFPESKFFLKNFWKNNSKKANVAVALILILFYLPALVQPSTGLSLRDDSLYVYNDMTGLAAGNFPLADFMPHYNSLFGWPIYLTAIFFGTTSVFYTVPALISILNLCVILILTKLIKKIYLGIPFLIALLGACSLLVTSSSEFPGAFTNQSFPSWVSRMFLPSCLGFITYSFFSATDNSKKRWLISALGFLAFLTLVNNLEFGLTAFVAISLVVLLFAIFKLIPVIHLLFFTFGVTFSIICFWGAYALAGRDIRPDFYFMISQEVAANGYFSWPMPTFGLYVLAFSAIGISLIFSLQNLKYFAQNQELVSSSNNLGTLSLSLFGGLWSIQCLTYYSARSVDGNLRALFVPILLALMPLGKLCNQSPKKQPTSKGKVWLWLPSLLVSLLPLALIVKAPDPKSNFTRLVTQNSAWSWQTTKNRAISIEFGHLSSEAKTKTGVMAFDGNSLEIVSGARNFLLLPNFEIHKLSKRILTQSCSALVNSGVENVLVEGNFLNSDPPCPQLSNPKLLANGSVTSYTLRP
jgi:hypothetical protein